MDCEAMPQESGIYIIRNTVNKNIYVGQAQDLRKRAKDHVRAANTGVRHHLYHSMRKHGIDKFSISVLEMCEEKNLDDRENFWIDLYQATEHGYNICKFARSARGTKRSRQQILSRTGATAPKSVTLYDFEQDTTKRFISYSEALRFIGSGAKINHCFAKNGCVFIKKRYLIIKGNLSLIKARDRFVRFKEHTLALRKNASRIPRSVVKLDDNKNVIETYKSMYDASKAISSDAGSISNSIKYGWRSRGFYWKYEEEVQQAQ